MFDIYEFLKKRPLSWSAISSFEYSPQQWYDRYVLGKKTPENSEMLFGKLVGEKIATDPSYLPFVPRYGKFEHEFKVVYNNIPLIGFADSFCLTTDKKLLEFKTGVKKWDQKRVNAHGQITMYCLMHYITKKVKPEEMDIALVWLPTKRKESGDFVVTISFVEPIEKSMKIFKTTRSMKDILKFGIRINKVVKEMQEYVNNK